MKNFFYSKRNTRVRGYAQSITKAMNTHRQIENLQLHVRPGGKVAKGNAAVNRASLDDAASKNFEGMST